MGKVFKLSVLIVLVIACSRIEEQNIIPEDSFKYSFSACYTEGSKTTLDGTILSWERGDKIGVFVSDGLQYNMPFYNVGEDTFEGSFKITGRSVGNVCYRAYYPQTFFEGKRVESDVLMAELPVHQKAPFDSSADFIISDPIYAAYDESNMPELSLVFTDHLFSIIKLTVTNSNPEYAEDRLLGADIIAENNILAGKFTVDISKPGKGVVFSEDGASNFVSSDFPQYPESFALPPRLGVGIKHTLYFVTNTFSAFKLKVQIRTTRCAGQIESAKMFSSSRGEVINLPEIDFGGMNTYHKNKVLLYWGDSIAPQVLTDYLQGLLGPSWKVIRGGIGGDDPWEIAGRQGGVPMCLKSSCTLPGDSSQKVEVPGIYSVWDSHCEYNPGAHKVNKYTWFMPETYGVLLNNCLIEGVECVFSYDEDTGQVFLQRAYDGEDVTFPAGSIVHSYGSIMYRDALLHVTYMGTNGRESTEPGNDEILVKFYNAMNAFALNSDAIEVGFHWRQMQNRTNWGWTQDYCDLFTSTYGNHYLDLRTYGNQNADRLLVETGVYTDISRKSKDDIYTLSLGDWPSSWQTDYKTNVHPNEYGSRAIATMVYEKMKELGYLDE